MHPRLGLALRTAIAGGLAWLAAELLPRPGSPAVRLLRPHGSSGRHRRLWLAITERLRQLQDALRDPPQEAPFDTALPDSTELQAARRRVETQLAKVQDARRANRKSRRHNVQARLAQARAVVRVAVELQDFQRSLQELGPSSRPDPSRAPESASDWQEHPQPGELDQRLADAIELIRNALHQGSLDDLDRSLEPTLAALDEVISRYQLPGPGQHRLSTLVNQLRQLALAARQAVAHSVAQD